MDVVGEIFLIEGVSVVIPMRIAEVWAYTSCSKEDCNALRDRHKRAQEHNSP